MPTDEKLLCTLDMLETETPDDPVIQALRTVYDRALKVFNNDHRVHNAMLLLLNGNIVSIKQSESLVPSESVFMIQAQGHETVFYKVTKDSCNCADKGIESHFKTKGAWCKHKICRAMVLRTQSLLEHRRKNLVTASTEN
jgi:hypothetical protein